MWDVAYVRYTCFGLAAAWLMAGDGIHRDRASTAPVTSNTAFRIASMMKSFTALAVLKLRDEGKLSLEDPVAKWIAEFARMELPTRDTPPLRIRQLLSHSAGFPEDNPWGATGS
jgi:CubicO group peptidase (beta-lactamase class C family)